MISIQVIKSFWDVFSDVLDDYFLCIGRNVLILGSESRQYFIRVCIDEAGRISAGCALTFPELTDQYNFQSASINQSMFMLLEGAEFSDHLFEALRQQVEQRDRDVFLGIKISERIRRLENFKFEQLIEIGPQRPEYQCVVLVNEQKAIKITINRWDYYLYCFIGGWDDEKRIFTDGRPLFLNGNELVERVGDQLQPAQASIDQLMRAFDSNPVWANFNAGPL